MLFEHRVLAYIVEVGVDGDHAIEGDLHATAFDVNLLLVPFTGRLLKAGARGEHVIDGGRVLLGLDLTLVLRVLIVQNLDLHADISGVTGEGRANADAIVAAGRQFIL